MKVRSIIVLVLTLATLVTVAAFVAGIRAWQSLNEPLQLPAEGVVVEIDRGTSLGGLASRLADDGVLQNARALVIYSRFSGHATRIQAGEYRLSPGLTPVEMLEMFGNGSVVMHQFAIIEGWRFADMLAGLRAHPAVAQDELVPDEIMAAIGSPDLHPEGQFLPDTYFFPKGTRAVEILKRAHDALKSRLDTDWMRRDPSVQLATPYEALILASIIEKETALASERPLISGVFHERLKQGMRLQTDPTVIYGLGESFDGNLRAADLRTDTPYNTYTRRGLPPTPIALPGAAAIAAAVQPQFEGYLYFVATGESDGSHRFSRTIDEHNEAVRAYLRRERED